MAYDTEREVTVLFGGTAGVSTFFDDTWEWDGTTWTQRFPANEPTKRHSHDMVYDSLRGVTILFGGYYYSSIGPTEYYYGQTWEYANVTTPEPEFVKIFLPLVLR
jgi:hypothetical protein